MRLPRWGQPAVFVALCFAAATAIPFLPPDAQDAFAAHALGAPPLLILAAATVTGTAALVGLRATGFFGEGPTGFGLRDAAGLAVALALPAVLIDMARPLPFGAAAWPAAWLLYPSLAVAATALWLTPLGLVQLLARRPALAIAAAVLAEAGFLWLGAAGLPGSQRGALALHAAVTALVAAVLLRRHGILAATTFRVAFFVLWFVLWGAARAALGLSAAP